MDSITCWCKPYTAHQTDPKLCALYALEIKPRLNRF